MSSILHFCSCGIIATEIHYFIMPIASIRHLPFLNLQKPKAEGLVGLGLSLCVSVLYAIAPLQEAFENSYVVQDDARQHVFWMRRFVDPELFPNDLTADYFQSVAPWAYTTLYKLFAAIGVDPLLLSKLLPIALVMVATAYCFGVCWQILPTAIAGFAAALLLNQSLWMRDDVVSATPAAFVYPLFLAFVYYALRGAWIPCLGTIALLGFCYPQYLLIAAGVLLLRMVQWRDRQICLTPQRERRLAIAGVGLAIAVLLPYLFTDSPFGAVITTTAAKLLPAFSPEGWSSFFSDRFWSFWFFGKRSGLLPAEWSELITNHDVWLLPPQIWLSAALMVLLRLPDRFPLARQVQPTLWILPQVIWVAIALFFAAHLLLFRLHLPNRYTEHSLKMVTAIAAGLAIALVIDAVWRFWRDRQPGIALGLIMLLSAALFVYPELLRGQNYDFPKASYIDGEFPRLYAFLQQQPKDIVVASLAEEANNLPSFAQRRILVGGEGYALPYHSQYYQQVVERSEALIAAQYSASWETIGSFLRDYDIDFWLIDRLAFTPEYIGNDGWLRQYPTALASAERAIGQQRPVLQTALKDCAVLKERDLILLTTQCLVAQSENERGS